MKHLATQAYITYLHTMIEALEGIKSHQAVIIGLLEAQVKDLSSVIEIHQKSHEARELISKNAQSE